MVRFIVKQRNKDCPNIFLLCPNSKLLESLIFQVIEVHDGRIPLSGRYVRFGGHITGHRPHLLVLNKKDLVSSFSCTTVL